MSDIKLCINIDHVATIRQARMGVEPDPVGVAPLCEDAGAHGITIHLREDRRHIQDYDVFALRDVVRGKFNLEMALSQDVIQVAERVLPHQITLVPEKREELTTEGGLDVIGKESIIREFVQRFHEKGVIVSLFIEPDEKIVEYSHKTGADYIEIHTGTYCNADEKSVSHELQKIFRAAELAKSLGLGINAGHGLNYTNVVPILGIDGLEELNIGHSIISRSVFTGIGSAVKEMLQVIEQGIA